MIICFELTMPNHGSWNGRWSGEKDGHYLFKTSQVASMKNRFQELDGGSWYYRWDDGWGACITARIVDAKEKTRLQKKNAGFSGYDWMVKDILVFGEIQKR